MSTTLTRRKAIGLTQEEFNRRVTLANAPTFFDAAENRYYTTIAGQEFWTEAAEVCS